MSSNDRPEGKSFLVRTGAYEAGQAHLEANQPIAAKRDFKRAIDHYPRFGHPYDRLGRLLDRVGDTNQAISSLEEASERYPHSDPGLWDPSAPTVAEADFLTRRAVTTCAGPRRRG